LRGSNIFNLRLLNPQDEALCLFETTGNTKPATVSHLRRPESSDFWQICTPKFDKFFSFPPSESYFNL
jgi:hypothetical protein